MAKWAFVCVMWMRCQRNCRLSRDGKKRTKHTMFTCRDPTDVDGEDEKKDWRGWEPTSAIDAMIHLLKFWCGVIEAFDGCLPQERHDHEVTTRWWEARETVYFTRYIFQFVGAIFHPTFWILRHSIRRDATQLCRTRTVFFCWNIHFPVLWSWNAEVEAAIWIARNRGNFLLLDEFFNTPLLVHSVQFDWGFLVCEIEPLLFETCLSNSTR